LKAVINPKIKMKNPTKEPNPNTVPGEIGRSGRTLRMMFFGLSKTDHSIKTTKNTITNPPVTKILNSLKMVSETGITPNLMAKKWLSSKNLKGAKSPIPSSLRRPAILDWAVDLALFSRCP
jgi:hypothetical protein